METAPDDSERARAAVAASCLAWLRCTGAGAVAIEPLRHDREAVRRLLAGGPPPAPDPRPSPDHPLWDSWLDG